MVVFIVARPVRSFLASPSVGAGFDEEDIKPKPSNASLSLLCTIRSCFGRSILDPVNARGVSFVVGPFVFGLGLSLGGRPAVLGSCDFQSFSAKSSPKPIGGNFFSVFDVEELESVTLQTSLMLEDLPGADVAACHTLS